MAYDAIFHLQNTSHFFPSCMNRKKPVIFSSGFHTICLLNFCFPPFFIPLLELQLRCLLISVHSCKDYRCLIQVLIYVFDGEARLCCPFIDHVASSATIRVSSHDNVPIGCCEYLATHLTSPVAVSDQETGAVGDTAETRKSFGASTL